MMRGLLQKDEEYKGYRWTLQKKVKWNFLQSKHRQISNSQLMGKLKKFEQNINAQLK